MVGGGDARGDAHGEDFGGWREGIEFGLEDGSDGVTDFGGVAGEETRGEVELRRREKGRKREGRRKVSFEFLLPSSRRELGSSTRRPGAVSPSSHYYPSPPASRCTLIPANPTERRERKGQGLKLTR